MRAADLRTTGRRIQGVGAVFLLAFVTLTVRAAHLTVIDSRGSERGLSQTVSVLRVPGARGTLTDRHGAELALSVEVPSVYAIPPQITDPDATARALARALNRSVDSVRRRLRSRSPFVYVARWLEPARAAKVEALELAGVGLVQEPRRTYPYGELAGRVIGFANIDGHGARAVEQMEDAWLAGHAQRVGVERDARHRLLLHSGFDPRRTMGGDVALTLDATLQAEVEQALAEVTRATGAQGGVVVVLEVRTGDVLAVAETPVFDPNRFRETPYAATASRAFLSAPEPGSTLKPIVVAAALERGAIRPTDEFDCEEGRFRVPGKVIRDSRPHGRLDPAGILRVSSNIGAAKIGFQLGARSEHELLGRFGFGAVTGSGFPDESAGLLRSWSRWRPVDHANISFGQGINTTVVQMATAMAALAGGGVWRTPRLVAARREAGGRWQPAEPSRSRRVVRAEVAEKVMRMLEGVVSEGGTGRRAGLRGLRVAGKTGTAQKLDPETGTYSNRRYRAWFIGAVPAEAPEVALAVVLDEPRGRLHGGGSVAAPLFARAATAALARRGRLTAPLFDLPELARIDAEPPRPRAAPEPARAVAARSPKQPAPTPQRSMPAERTRREPPARTTSAGTPRPPAGTEPRRPGGADSVARLGDRLLLPDLRGLSRGQVQSLLHRAALRVELVGSGLAVEQFPAPGTIVAGAAAVRVRFEEGG